MSRPHHRAAQRRAGSASSARAELARRRWSRPMVGRELAGAAAARPPCAPAVDQRATAACCRRADLAAPRPAAADGPARSARGRGAGPGGPAGLGPHRAGAPAVRPRRRRLAASSKSTASRVRFADAAPTRSPRAWRSARKTARPTASWPSCRCARTSRWRCRRAWALRRYLVAAEQTAAGRALRAPRWASRPPASRRRSAALRRQPAEGHAGALAGHQAAPADPRRAHARHRRGRQAGDHGRRSCALAARRHGGAVHLVRNERGGAGVAPHRGAARPRARSGELPARQQRGRGVRTDRGAPKQPDDAAVSASTRLFGAAGLAAASRCCCCWRSTPASTRLPRASTWRDGHLYGSLIDILNRAAPLMLVSLGMTLVIATRGIDISVGAVVAIAGAVAALLIGGSFASAAP